MFQPPLRVPGNVHVEFRAGRMDWDGRMVTPDKRKGKIVLFTSEDEQLMHFQWHDREKNEVGIDLIVINDAYFERVEQCTTGRVYILRFTSSDKKLFFWMQEPKTEGDAELISRFNDAIGAKAADKTADAPPAPAAAPATVPTGQGGQPMDPQLRAILQQFMSQEPQGPRTPPVPLGAVLTTEVLLSLLSDEAAAAEMRPLLPVGQQSEDDLRMALGSPQLQQSLQSLSQAVHSDQLPVLFASLGLDPGVIASAAPGSDALEVLCRAMESQYGSGGTEATSGGGEGTGAGGAATGGGGGDTGAGGGAGGAPGSV